MSFQMVSKVLILQNSGSAVAEEQNEDFNFCPALQLIKGQLGRKARVRQFKLESVSHSSYHYFSLFINTKFYIWES